MHMGTWHRSVKTVTKISMTIEGVVEMGDEEEEAMRTGMIRIEKGIGMDSVAFRINLNTTSHLQ